MKALVTGATGFVGSHLVERLLQEKVEVRALIRNPQQLGALRSASHLEIFEGDVTDPLRVLKAVHGVDHVFHLAAVVHFWGRYKKQMIDTNVNGTRHIINACLQHQTPRLLHVSTAAVLKRLGGGQKSTEATPTHRKDMIGPYEQSKYDAEQLVLQAVQEKQLQAVVVNPPGPIGPYDIKPSPMGKVLVDFFKGNIPAYTDTGLNVVDVQDVVEGIWLAQHKGKIGERYLLGGTNLTLLEFLQLLESLSGKPAPRWRIPYSLTLLGGLFGEIWGRLRNQDPLANLHSVRMAKYAHWYDSSKAQEELGFQARDIRPALQAAIQWFREQNYIP